MSAAGIDTRLLELLQRASNLELFELNAVIERMLADPRRILQVRRDLHLGQSVRFMDWRDGRMRVGKVIDLELPDGLEGAEALVRSAAEKLLSNPVIEDYRLELVD